VLYRLLVLSRFSPYLPVYCVFRFQILLLHHSFHFTFPLYFGLRGLIKLHTPVASWRNTPGYKLAQCATDTLAQYIALPYAFNVKLCTDLIHNLNGIYINSENRFVSSDINNMYTNLPTSDLIKKMCKNEI
jgi:hypothetical protein